MSNAPLLAYFIARRNASELDRAGSRPGIFLQALFAVSALASLAMGAVLLFGFAIVVAGAAGWY